MYRLLRTFHVRQSLLLALMSVPVIAAPAMAAEPVITGVVANFSSPTPYITITGANVGTTKPTVHLGDYGTLVVTTFSAGTVTATLPSPIIPGSYLLTLRVPGKSGGLDEGGVDEFWVTLGTPWTSLGHLGSLTRNPQPDLCDQRFIANFNGGHTIFMPSAKIVFADHTLFRFGMDMGSLAYFAESQALQRAIPDYNGFPSPKSLTVEIQIFNDPAIGSDVVVSSIHLDALGGASGSGYGSAAIGMYEVQERCP